jgi:hypothetical protein
VNYFQKLRFMLEIQRDFVSYVSMIALWIFDKDIFTSEFEREYAFRQKLERGWGRHE